MDPKKLKTLDDFAVLAPPFPLQSLPDLEPPVDGQWVLRMLIKPKYSNYRHVPESLSWLHSAISRAHDLDERLTGIPDLHKWCYVTVRHGVDPNQDNTYHFDGGSLRTELIPERNYVYNASHPLRYKLGTVKWPVDFDPMRHNMFDMVERQEGLTEHTAKTGWNLLYPNVFHARTPGNEFRTFVRITFTDIEIRDCRVTQNPELPTESYGRDPVKSFRDGLSCYEG